MYKDFPLYPITEFPTSASAVQNAIDICLTYNPKERLNNPLYGCGLEDLLFELIDEVTAIQIKIKLLY